MISPEPSINPDSPSISPIPIGKATPKIQVKKGKDAGQTAEIMAGIFKQKGPLETAKSIKSHILVLDYVVDLLETGTTKEGIDSKLRDRAEQIVKTASEAIGPGDLEVIAQKKQQLAQELRAHIQTQLEPMAKKADLSDETLRASVTTTVGQAREIIRTSTELSAAIDALKDGEFLKLSRRKVPDRLNRSVTFLKKDGEVKAYVHFHGKDGEEEVKLFAKGGINILTRIVDENLDVKLKRKPQKQSEEQAQFALRSNHAIRKLKELEIPHAHLPDAVPGSSSASEATIDPLVRGKSLKARLESGSLTTDEGKACMRGVTSFLAELHLSNLSHRDIKPDNIMITEKGPIIMDYDTMTDIEYAQELSKLKDEKMEALGIAQQKEKAAKKIAGELRKRSKSSPEFKEANQAYKKAKRSSEDAKREFEKEVLVLAEAFSLTQLGTPGYIPPEADTMLGITSKPLGEEQRKPIAEQYPDAPNAAIQNSLQQQLREAESPEALAQLLTELNHNADIFATGVTFFQIMGDGTQPLFVQERLKLAKSLKNVDGSPGNTKLYGALFINRDYKGVQKDEQGARVAHEPYKEDLEKFQAMALAKGYTQEQVDTVIRSLDHDPSKRPDAKELNEAFNE